MAWAEPTPAFHGWKNQDTRDQQTRNQYLRKQLIHGARAAMPHMAAKQTTIGVWLQQMLSRSHPNVVVVALAAKLARIVWAVLRHKTSFDQEVLV